MHATIAADSGTHAPECHVAPPVGAVSVGDWIAYGDESLRICTMSRSGRVVARTSQTLDGTTDPTLIELGEELWVDVDTARQLYRDLGQVLDELASIPYVLND